MGLFFVITFSGFMAFLLFVFLFRNFVNNRRGQTAFSIISNIFIAFGSITLLVFCMYYSIKTLIFDAMESSSYESSYESSSGYAIDGFHVELDVNENHSILVTEDIAANFQDSTHHGIYRFIPSWLKYTNKENETMSRKSIVRDLKAIGDPYYNDVVGYKSRIIIGDEDVLLEEGIHNYQIQYYYDMDDDPYKGYDEFIFHFFGDYWDTSIHNASVDIHMPKEIDKKTVVHFYKDKFRKNDISRFVDYTVLGKDIVATVDPDFSLNSSLTVAFELPDGYFIPNNHSIYGNTSYALCLICFVIAFLSFLLWLLYGKDNRKEEKTMEFVAPDGLDSSEIGYLDKHSSGKRLAISLIVQLASKGAIVIDEQEDSNTLYIKKRYPTSISSEIKRKIKVHKLKDAPKIKIAPYIENFDLFDKLFKDKDEAIVDCDFHTFEDLSSYLIENGYMEITSDTLKQYSSEAIQNIQNQLLKREEENLPKLSENERLVYDVLFENGDEVDLFHHRSFYSVYNQLTINLNKKFSTSVYDSHSDMMMLFSSLGYCASIVFFLIAFCFVKDLNPLLSYYYTFGFISILVTLFFTIIMSRKTSYGEKLIARIKGFKKYIETAEKDRIKSLEKNNANYFYDILPYAYALGVSKKWTEKFDKIPDSIHKMGNFNIFDTNELDYLYNYIYTPSSGSSSSCGGGCSSCGGGCSSCGGGGSW